MVQKMIKAAALAGFVLTAASAAFATPVSYTEVGDAGDIVTGAVQTVTGAAGSAVTSIKGSLTATAGITDGDAFKIYISAPSAFSASTTGFTPGRNSFDSELFLFNLDGTGIVMNDDDPAGTGEQSSIAAGNAFTDGLSAGYYYLLITGQGMNPTSAGGLIFPSWTDGTTDPTGLYGPNPGASAITGFGGNSNEGGAYSIALSGVSIAPAVGTVPEPGTLGLGLTAGLMLLALVRRRHGKPDAQ